MVERKPQFKPIEKVLIEKAAILRRPDELINDVQERGFKESDIRSSIWSLIARGHLDLDEMRRIQANASHPHQLYLLPREQ